MHGSVKKADEAFAGYKRQVLSNLNAGIDFSPKGSVDAPVADLVALINQLPMYVTTSSCSGRVSVHYSTGSSKGVHWLLVSHGPVTTQAILEAVSSTTDLAPQPKWIMLKCEPCILHVCCMNLDHARNLLAVAQSCGFRESGISFPPGAASKVMLAIRTTAFAMDVPLTCDGRSLFPDAYLDEIVAEANRRLRSNFERMDKLLGAIKDSFHYPTLRSAPTVSRAAPADGHLATIDCVALRLSSGGRQGMTPLPCLSASLVSTGEPVRIVHSGHEPSPRWGHVFLDLGDGSFLILGGRNVDVIFCDFILLQLTMRESALHATWSLLGSSPSVGRVHAAACALPSTVEDRKVGSVLVHGGLLCLQSLEATRSIVEIDVTSREIRPVGSCEWTPRKFGHSLTVLPGRCILGLGGAGDVGEDCWLADYCCGPVGIESLTRRKLAMTGPLPCSACRVHHRSQWCKEDGKITVCGGGSIALGFGRHCCIDVEISLVSGAEQDDRVVSASSNSEAGVVSLVTCKSSVKRLKTFLEQHDWLDKGLKICSIEPDRIIGKRMGAVKGAWDEESCHPTDGNDYMVVPIRESLGKSLRASTIDSDTWSALLAAAPQLWLHEGTAKPKGMHHRVEASQWLERLGRDSGISQESLCLPSKYEVVGDVLMIPDGCIEGKQWEGVISKMGSVVFWSSLARFFDLPRVARKRRIDSGPMRESRTTMLLNPPRDAVALDACICEASHAGDEGWVTVLENHISFSFDLCKVMFCSGNNTERMRMGSRKIPDEVVVDLYAGIGYYTVPLLVHGQAKRVFACEWNPNSLRALRHNLAVAQVSSRCVVLPGDNQKTTVELDGIADRVLLGLLPSSQKGWPLAARALKKSGGVIHVHENVADADLVVWTSMLVEEFNKLFAAEHKPLSIQVLHTERVKSYAPRVGHYVVDLLCSRDNAAV